MAKDLLPVNKKGGAAGRPVGSAAGMQVARPPASIRSGGIHLFRIKSDSFNQHR